MPGYWRPFVVWTPAYTTVTAEAARTAVARSAAKVRAMVPAGMWRHRVKDRGRLGEGLGCQWYSKIARPATGD